MAAPGLLLLLLPLLPLRARADEHEHTYQDKEEVVLWMNTVGPYHNRQETYKYFSLPFCVGSKKSISHYHETLGEALQGVELEFSGLDIKFKDDVMQTTYCEVATQLRAFPKMNRSHMASTENRQIAFIF